MKDERTSNTFVSKFKSIRSAMMFSFSALIIAAIIVFFVIALNYTRSTVLNNSVTYTNQIINQVNDEIDSYINYMENISAIVTNSDSVQSYLFSDPQPEVLEEERQRIITQFETVRESREDIVNIAAISDKRVIVNSGEEELTPYVDIEETFWYQNMLQASDGIDISSSHVQNAIYSSYEWVITLSRTVENQNTNQMEGTFFIDLNYESISNLCDKNKIGDKGYVYIIDESGSIIYHPQQQLLHGGLKTEKIEEVLEAKNNYFITDEGGESKLYTLSTSEDTGWTVVGVTYVSEVLEDFEITQMLYGIMALVLIVAVIIISNMVAKAITDPIGKLRRAMRLIEEGNFEEAEIKGLERNEIGILEKSLNNMNHKIQNLMEQNVYEQQQKRKSEMMALQSQINPHFLYNTLDSIIWMSAGGKNEEVVDMTSALAKLFRQSISNEKEQISIRDEIQYVRNYLVIQGMRYKDKLEYSFEVDPAMLEVKIIKFALQPLVENAIYHGLKYKEEKGHLTIRGYIEGEKAIIEVIDDGVGMTEEALANVFKEKPTNYKSNGVGTVNVQKRLQLYYGSDYGLSFRSAKGAGTIATVKIPVSGGELQ